MMAKKELRVRRARGSDASRIAELATQLGYPATTREMATRLRTALRHKDGACIVAEAAGQGVVGWIHISVTPLLEVERRAEVNGLVVDEQTRNSGVGALLLSAAESWAKKRGCKNMSVRSNVIRDRAHAFYLRNGYEHYKTQKAFRKLL